MTQLPGGEIVPALERGVIEAFEFNNPTSDRQFGAQDVRKHYMMGSYHQAAEFFEIIFNQDKYQLSAERAEEDPGVCRRGRQHGQLRHGDGQLLEGPADAGLNKDGVKVHRTRQADHAGAADLLGQCPREG